MHGNYLKGSIRNAGLDPDDLPESDPSKMNFGGDSPSKAWKDIWGCGQGIGAVKAVVAGAPSWSRGWRASTRRARAKFASRCSSRLRRMRVIGAVLQSARDLRVLPARC